MMDPDPIPQGNDLIPDTEYVDAKKRRQCSPTPPDPMSKVLDNDDLLIEILIRLGFPTTLVHAALVCKRWFRHASDPAFLRRFHKLHPPRVLGFYINIVHDWSFSRFFPMLPQPPELDAVICCARFSVEAYKSHVMNCRNGVVYTKLFNSKTGFTYELHSPLCPDRGMASIAPIPCPQNKDHNLLTYCGLQFKEEGSSFSCFSMWIESSKEGTKSTVHLYVLQNGVWCIHTSSTTPLPCLLQDAKPLLAGNKIYMAATMSYILVLDLTSSSFSTIQLSQGLVFAGIRTMFSRDDDDFGVYLIHLNIELQLHIWHHKGDNWLLVDTICLRDMCAKLRMSDNTFEDDHATVGQLSQVGDNADFVFLRTGPKDRYILYLDIKCRTLGKVCKITENLRCLYHYVHPLKMIWPPTFPALKDDPARFAFWTLIDPNINWLCEVVNTSFIRITLEELVRNMGIAREDKGVTCV